MPSPMSVTSGCVAFRVGSLCSTSLPHREYAAGPPSPACTVSRDLVNAPQTVSQTHGNHQTRLCYSVQFAQHHPKFIGIQFTYVLNKDAPVLHAEIAVLLAKDTKETVLPAEMKSGFYSTYFIVPKKGGGLWPIWDLRVLNRALYKLPFRMFTQKCIFQCIRPSDWFAAIDLKDAYFHVSSLPFNTGCFSASRSRGEPYQYQVLPIEHRFGLQVNWEKSKLYPVQRISFFGMELDSVNLTVHVVPGWYVEVLGGLPPAVLNAVPSARAPSTWHRFHFSL